MKPLPNAERGSVHLAYALANSAALARAFNFVSAPPPNHVRSNRWSGCSSVRGGGREQSRSLLRSPGNPGAEPLATTAVGMRPLPDTVSRNRTRLWLSGAL